MNQQTLAYSLSVGNGWSYNPVEDIYFLNRGEFVVSRSFVTQRMMDWGRKVEMVHIISVLNSLYRESRS